MYVYIPLRQGPKAASITCIHVIISSNMHLVLPFQFLSCLLKNPKFIYFYTLSSFLHPFLMFLRILELNKGDDGSQMEDTDTFHFSCSLSLILKIECCSLSLTTFFLFTLILHASHSACPPSPHTSYCLWFSFPQIPVQWWRLIVQYHML